MEIQARERERETRDGGTEPEGWNRGGKRERRERHEGRKEGRASAAKAALKG